MKIYGDIQKGQVDTDAYNPQKEKERITTLVKDLITHIASVKEEILQESCDQALKQTEEAVATMEQSYIEPVTQYFAEKVYDKMKNPPDELTVVEGYCGPNKHQWMIIEGEPQKVEEPIWKYLIDPSPVGVSGVIKTSVLSSIEVLVFEPYNAWQKYYAGNKIVRGDE